MDSDENRGQAPIAYADEVLCANWHPLVFMLAEPLARSPRAAPDAAPDPAEAAALLARLYLSQRA